MGGAAATADTSTERSSDQTQFRPSPPQQFHPSLELIGWSWRCWRRAERQSSDLVLSLRAADVGSAWLRHLSSCIALLPLASCTTRTHLLLSSAAAPASTAWKGWAALPQLCGSAWVTDHWLLQESCSRSRFPAWAAAPPWMWRRRVVINSRGVDPTQTLWLRMHTVCILRARDAQQPTQC